MVVVGIGEKINKKLKKRSHGCCGIDHLAIGGGTASHGYCSQCI
jgi:hypothetical protein